MLDDRELTAGTDVPGHYDLGTLEARSEHTITVKDLKDPSGASTVADLSWTFKTGDALEEAPDSSALRVVSTGARLVESGERLECSEALFANSCFDTGPPHLDTFEVETDADVELWVIELVTETRDAQGWYSLPAECGEPQVLTIDSRPFGEAPRYRIHGVLRDGTVVTSEDVPSPALATPTSDASAAPAGIRGESAGCSTTGSASAPASWLALVALLPWLRRRLGSPLRPRWRARSRLSSSRRPRR